MKFGSYPLSICDQWDWKVISKEDRNEDYLRRTVEEIYEVFKATEEMINSKYPNF